MTANIKAEVGVVGAGLVGLAAAVAMQQLGQSVVLIDAKMPSKTMNPDVWDSRIYAVSTRNVEWLKTLGVWQLLDTSRIGKMQAMEIWGDDEHSLNLCADDANADFLGFIVEGNALAQALLQRVEALKIQCLFGAKCESLMNSGQGVHIYLNEGSVVDCELLLAADGSSSWVRQQLSIAAQNKPYQQVGIVANFEVEKPHQNIARQWFAHDDNNQNAILAFLPLSENKISIVWSVSEDYGAELLALSESDFIRKIMQASNHALGEMRLMTPPEKFALQLQKLDTLFEGSVVMIGDAAHQIHPLAGQGLNLGFRDVIDLATILSQRNIYQKLSDNSLLKRYSRVRKADVFNIELLTDGLYRLFASQNAAVRAVRNRGLLATNHLAIKKLLVKNAMAL